MLSKDILLSFNIERYKKLINDWVNRYGGVFHCPLTNTGGGVCDGTSGSATAGYSG